MVKEFLKGLFYKENKVYQVKFNKNRYAWGISFYFIFILVFAFILRIMFEFAKGTMAFRGFGQLDYFGNFLIFFALVLNLYTIVKFVLIRIDDDVRIRFRACEALREFSENNNFVERERDKQVSYDSQGKKKYKDVVRLLYFPSIFYSFNNDILVVTFRLDGHKYSKHYDSLGEQLSNMFVLDLQSAEVKKGDAIYIFRRTDLSRENVSDIVDNNVFKIVDDSIILSDRYTWNFRKSPHGLISGITGSGKTFLFAYFIIMFIRMNAMFKIVDPKRADLMYLSKYFGDDVVYKHAQALRILRESCELIDERMSNFQLREDYRFGADYADYNTRPYFIIFDEASAFVALLSKKEKEEYDKYVSKIVLEGRQAGIFIIFAMQRPDTDFIKGALRDQLGLRVALGQMSSDGYRMVFGNEGKDLNLVDKNAGFLMDSKMTIPEEFFTPYLDIDFIEKLEQMINYENKNSIFVNEDKKVN